MATFLFDQTIFGPVISRRLGVSLGINLLPNDSKICSFNCLYCECGWNPEKGAIKIKLPSREEVKLLLQEKLVAMAQEGTFPDVITFAGNGEPTMHPAFEGIIEDTLKIRDRYAPKARVAVLSNATMLHKAGVIRALLKIDDNIQKLDSAIPATISRLDQPVGRFKVDQVVDQLKAFEGEVIIQTMFLRGSHEGVPVDNTTEAELAAWIELLKRIAPKQVMIYTIARDTPARDLQKVTKGELEQIAKRVKQEAGISVQVSG